MWTMSIGGESVSILGIVGLGAIAGFIAGMFGVGGGFLMTPLLNVVFGIPLPIAVGTGLCQMIGTACVSLLRHRSIGQGELRFDLVMLPGCLLGVHAGTAILDALSDSGTITIANRSVAAITFVIDALYIMLLLGTALLFWRQGRRVSGTRDEVRRGPLARVRLGPTIDLPRVPLHGVSAIVIAEIGFLLGVLSGLLGIGGGIALLPILMYGFGFPMRQAAGTGIVVLVATATSGTVLHALRDNVDLGLAMVLLLPSTLSAQVGALTTRRVDAHVLRRIFAFVVVTTAAAVLWDLVRRFS